jgi:hypothetical protein
MITGVDVLKGGRLSFPLMWGKAEPWPYGVGSWMVLSEGH